jgi:hypothetical protein
MVLVVVVVPAVDKVPAALAGQLNIDGKFVETLTLETEQGDLREIENPGPSWSLPQGRYCVREVHLRGGYHCYCYPAAEEGWFTLTSEEPYQLKVGAPLTPKVRVARSFRSLELDYELLDAGGRNYAGPGPEVPQFAVYSGDRKIGSGSFDYG